MSSNYFSSGGLPAGWTLPQVGSVNLSDFSEMFQTRGLAALSPVKLLNVQCQSKHRVNIEAGSTRLPVLSLFSGVGGLDLGLHELGPQIADRLY